MLLRRVCPPASHARPAGLLVLPTCPRVLVRGVALPPPPPPPPLAAQDLGEQVFPVHKLAAAGSVQGWYNCKKPGTAATKGAPDALGVPLPLLPSR